MPGRVKITGSRDQYWRNQFTVTDLKKELEVT